MRARNIKPDFFKNEELGECSFSERLLFIGLWCLSDREGFFEIRIKKMKAELFPYDNSVPINKMLSNLITRRLIESNGGHGYIPKFKKHQNPHPKEAKSNISEEIKNSLINQYAVKLKGKPCNYTKSRADMLNPESCILNPDIRNEERGMRKAQTSPSPPLDLSGLWNEQTQGRLALVSTITDKRKIAMLARLKATPKNQIPDTYWPMIISKILESDFCCGENDRNWQADFDWLLKPDTHIKVAEGKYDNKDNGRQLNQTQKAIIESEARDRERRKENEHKKKLT